VPRARPLPAPLDVASFGVQDAFALGVSPGELRRSILNSPFWGVRMAADSAGDLLARCQAALLVLTDGTVFSQVTAASSGARLVLVACLSALPRGQ